MPFTVVNLGSGTMSSPCPPNTSASRSSGDTFNSHERNAVNLEASSIPPIPITRLQENSVVFHASCAITSIGLVTTIIIAFGEAFATSMHVSLITFALA